MKTHKNWAVASFIFMLITVFSIVCKPLRKTHAFWGCMSLICMIGALASGHSLVSPKKKTQSEDVVSEAMTESEDVQNEA